MALRRLRRDGPYRVARGSADIRGWRVYDDAGEKLGVIGGLLYEPSALRVRFAIVDTWERQVAVPIADLDLDEDAKVVMARGYSDARLLKLPEYSDAAIEGMATVEDGEVRRPLADDEEPRGRARRAHPFDLLYSLTDDDGTPDQLDQPVPGHTSGVAPLAPKDEARTLIRRELRHAPVTFMASEPTRSEQAQGRRSRERRPYRADAPRIEAD